MCTNRLLDRLDEIGKYMCMAFNFRKKNVYIFMLGCLLFISEVAYMELLSNLK